MSILSSALRKSMLSRPSPAFLAKVKPHVELIAALTSGALLLFAWIASEPSSASFTALHILAFVIGGYAKAKEGIMETLQEKEMNVELLMILAAIGSASIGYWTEGAILIFIFALSGALETYTLNKSNREISALMDIQPDEALKVTETGYQLVPAEDLNIGDRILVKAGERLPADGVIVKGSTSIDESAITGESLPVYKEKQTEVFAGTVNLTGSITCEITKRAEDTLFQRIIHMVQQAQSEKSPSQLFIERFENIYVKAVLITVAIMLFLPHYLFGWSWTDTIYRAMILLVVASPCALVASIMPATLSAISKSARQGLLFKGGVHVENLSHIEAIAFDKTGTLTNGNPKVTDIVLKDESLKEEIFAVTMAIEQESNHPLAKAIVYALSQYELSLPSMDHVENVSGQGVEAQYKGETWKVGNAEFAGKEEALSFKYGLAEHLASEGKTIVFISKNNEILALFALKDTVRKEAKQAIESLKKQGIYTVMLTGDNPITAEAIAKEAGVQSYIAECMPEDKVRELKVLKQHFRHVAMIGDGINDAPALASANLGIAMGEGTDVALETADLVLMKNNLNRLEEAIHLSKRMNRVIKQNVIFSISVITLLIASNFLQLLDLPLGVIGHEGSTILVILNGLRLLK
ncbi:heavy metal translocating P-type ATPase [Halobacillus sp. Marseille-Q1614]|uniref:heavy metal translocating P-type ATPase n=1 Tax=Halobacillus sp. Marseille-Q1614 TaxID=2709134 RepID=UPI00156DC125|nr:heavy metal translocating P-type ATPase [Halobacillus sp. Marseille-Q1614]